MVNSALVGMPFATTRDELIGRGIYVQNFLPIPTKFPLWVGLALKKPDTPGLPHDSNADKLIIGSAIGIAVIFVITGFRFFSRVHSRTSRLGWDDFFMFWAALSGMGWLAIQIAMCTKGSLGKHLWDSTYEKYFWMQHLGHFNQQVFIIWSTLSKIAIVCFNWRLTGQTSIRWKYVHIACLCLVASYGIPFLLVNVLQYRPVPAAYNLITAASTTNYKSYIALKPYSAGLLTLHCVIDWILLGIPIVIVWRLQLARKTKIQAIVPLSIGAVGCIATILRFYYQWTMHGPDVLYDFLVQGRWAIVDTVITTTVTSLPACWGLISRNVDRFTSSYLQRSSSGSGSRAQKVSNGHFSNTTASKQNDFSDKLSDKRSRSPASSHTLGESDSQQHLAEKSSRHVEDLEQAVASDQRSEEERDNAIFSGYGIAHGHPNLRDDYERRQSAGG